MVEVKFGLVSWHCRLFILLAISTNSLANNDIVVGGVVFREPVRQIVDWHLVNRKLNKAYKWKFRQLRFPIDVQAADELAEEADRHLDYRGQLLAIGLSEYLFELYQSQTHTVKVKNDY